MASSEPQITHLLAQNKQLRDQLRSSGGPTGRDDPGQPFLEQVSKIENHLKEMDGVLQQLNVGVAVANTTLDGIDTRLKNGGQRIDDLSRRINGTTAAAMARSPTWWQMPVIIVGTITLLGMLYTAMKGLHLVR